MTERGVPDYNNGNKSGNSDKIKGDLEKITKNGKLTPAHVRELYRKYPDNEELVDQVLKQNAKAHQKTKKLFREIAQQIANKYSRGDRPLHEILDKMLYYKNKHGWSDADFNEFRKELNALLTGARASEIEYNQTLPYNRSRINRALGNYQPVEVTEGLNIKDSEHGDLSEILSMYENSNTLHKSVFMHSLMYEDCSLVAMTGEYNRERHTASNHIHPLIACMFLPKFDLFEIHMLYSNFGSIIKSRYEKKPILTEPDSLLFHDIVTDSNDVVCEVNSPIADLKKRYMVQIELWRVVTELRNGRYYNADSISQFMTKLNSCRNNLYDNVDIAYGQDEGTMLRRLLNVFSLRPTAIYTKPLASLMQYGMNPYNPGMNPFSGGLSPFGMQQDFGMGLGMGGQNGLSVNMGSGFGALSNPFSAQPVYTVTSIAMIVLQIPPFKEGSQPIDLREATSQTIWLNENKTIVPKEQTILYSNGVLIFYINRRVQRIQIKTFTNPLPFSQSPMTMSNFERLNSYPVNIPDRLSVGNADETYHLRSVVAVSSTDITQGEKTTNIITGCVGLIMTHRDFENNIYTPNYWLYDPFGASLPVKNPDAAVGGHFNNKPISRLEPILSRSDEFTGVQTPSFFDMASRAGTIMIYNKSGGLNNTGVISL